MRMKLIESTMIWYLCSYKNDNQANKHENITFLLTTCSTFVNRSAWFWSGFTKNMLTIPATKHLCDSWYTIDTFFFFNQDSGFIAFLHSYLQPYVLTAKCRWLKYLSFWEPIDQTYVEKYSNTCLGLPCDLIPRMICISIHISLDRLSSSPWYIICYFILRITINTFYYFTAFFGGGVCFFWSFIFNSTFCWIHWYPWWFMFLKVMNNVKGLH